MVNNFIKSNEDLSLANRKADTLYGILDQYTGEEITLIKITGTPPSIIDNIIYFQLGLEYFKRVFNLASIRWFGAVGDGVTDDSLAFSKVNDVFFNNITISLESGYNYLIGVNGVLFDSKTNFYFIGNSTIKYSAQTSLTIESLGFAGIKFSNSIMIGFKGVKFNVNGIIQAAVGFVNCIEEILDSCEIYSSASTVAQIVSAKAVRPRYMNNTIRDALGSSCRGMWIGNLTIAEMASEILISNNKVYNNKATGIVCATNGGEVYGNYSYNNLGSGIIFTGGNGLTTSNISCFGNKCNRNLYFGIQSDVVYSTDNDITRYITASNNICNENNSGGIYLANALGWTVIGNICNDNNFDGLGSGSGIELDGLVSDIIIKGNICKDTRVSGKTQTNGIACYAQSHNNKNIIINENICNGNLSNGINCQTVSSYILDNLIISENICCDNNSRGIFLAEQESNKMKTTVVANRCFNNTTQDLRISTRQAIIDKNTFNTSFEVRYLDFVDLDTTPNVGGRELWRANNSSATIIADFTGAYEGQKITILAANSNTTIEQGLIQLKNYSSALIPADGSITLIYQATVWRELSRSF